MKKGNRNVIIIGNKAPEAYLWKITETFLFYDEIEIKTLQNKLSKTNQLCEMIKNAYDVKEIEERKKKQEKGKSRNLEVITIRLCKKIF